MKEHYGPQGDRWWVEGIPVAIRKKCMEAWEEKNREGKKESNLYLIDYVNICINNWHLVKDVISLDARNKENKKANTKWIKRLNDIRKITTHPERGVLNTEQIAFVNKYYEKVKKYFPE